jgi:Holliday junction resolvase RusA-like endonuclease
VRIPRPDRPPDLTVRALGTPKPAGSKTSGVAYRKDSKGRRVPVTKPDGKLVTFVKDSSGEAGKDWRRTVASAGEDARAGAALLDGPLYVEMTFLRQRPKGHFGSGRRAAILKASAPLYPTTRPDATKLVRSAEDALTGVLWLDDSQIIVGPSEKVYAEANESEGVEIRIWTLPRMVGEVGEATLPLALAG